VHFEANQVSEKLISKSSDLEVNLPINPIPQSTLEIIREYYKIASLYDLKENESKRINEILEQATRDNLLDFWISEIDHLLGHRLGLLDDMKRKSYADQKAMLREYLGINPSCKKPAPETSCFPVDFSNLSNR
jgi:hypothetical protein